MTDPCPADNPRRFCNLRTGGQNRASKVAVAAVFAALCHLPATAYAGDTPGEAWPAAVKARYKLQFLGVTVGHLDMASTTTGGTYTMTGSGKVSVLFGAVVWSGSTSASGTIGNSEPVPTAYAHEWSNKKKTWAVQMRYKDRTASEVAVTPPPGDAPPDQVPVTPASKLGALDPVSAIMMLTRADGRPPCARRLAIFDGKQRYDLAFSFKRMTRLPLASGKETSEVAVVCRVTYAPIGGHRDNDATKSYAANRDVEVVLRRIPGTDMMIPHAVTIPTTWGTGSMTTERIDVTTGTGRKVAMGE